MPASTTVPAVAQRLGARLALFRTARHMSQAELGRCLTPPRQQSHVRCYEHGTVRLPADCLPAIADALHVPISAFFLEDSMSMVRAIALAKLAYRQAAGITRCPPTCRYCRRLAILQHATQGDPR